MQKMVDERELGLALQSYCRRDFGVVQGEFLCQPVSALDLPAPICMSPQSTVQEVMNALKSHKLGAVLIVDKNEQLCGIFTERDYVLKVYEVQGADERPISEFMTTDPVTESISASFAFVLNLMSHGGFRHLPLVDDEGKPIGVIGAKDVVDFIVARLTQDLLDIELED
jgi:CBS domain-containing protein